MAISCLHFMKGWSNWLTGQQPVTLLLKIILPYKCFIILNNMSEPAPHPSCLLHSSWIETLRKEAPKAELQGQLTAKQLKLFYDHEWFKALVPKQYGGLAWSLQKVVRFEEAIGWAEGSAGWVFTLCSGAGWFAGYIDPAMARIIFKPKKACLAGSGAVGGTVKSTGSGDFNLSGQWAYATGAPHATIFTANVYVEATKSIQPLFLFPSEVSVIKTWRPIGLKASASESFKVKRRSIPTERFFLIDPDKAVINDPLYRLPFEALAEATIAANFSGMALRFMEEVKTLWDIKNKKAMADNNSQGQEPVWMQGAVALWQKNMENWQAARRLLIHEIKGLEDFVCSHMSIPFISSHKAYQEHSLAVSKAAQQQAAICREIVNGLYPYTGLTGAATDSAVGKVWRDFQTGSQHALFVPELTGTKKVK